MKMFRLTCAVLVAVVGTSFAQSSQQCKDRPILQKPGCYLGGATKTERNEYNAADKDAQRSAGMVQRQETVVKKECAPSLNPIAAAVNVQSGRTPFESEKCVQSKERLDVLKEDADARQQNAQKKKEAYEKAKKTTGAIR